MIKFSDSPKSDALWQRLADRTNPELAEAYGVMSIPTLYVIRDGKAVKKSMGALPKAQLLLLME